MPKPRAYRSNKGLDADGPNWSYSHFVIGIVVMIGFGVTCFVVGYVIATNERPLNANSQIAANSTPPSTEASPPETKRPASSKKPDRAPKPKADKITAPEATVKRPDPSPIKITPLPAPGMEPTHMVKTPVTLPRPSGGEGPKITPPAVTSATNTTPKDRVAVTRPVAKKPVPAPVVSPTTRPAPKKADPPPKPVKATTPKVARGSWGIQVAFFDGKDRKKQAETVKKRLRSGAKQKAIVMVSNDNKEYRVFIDGFSTREAAKAACEKLKSKTGFADAWVKRLP